MHEIRGGLVSLNLFFRLCREFFFGLQLQAHVVGCGITTANERQTAE